MGGRVVETIFSSSNQKIDNKTWGYGWNSEVNFDKSPTLKRTFESVRASLNKDSDSHTVWKGVYDSVNQLYSQRSYDEVQYFHSRHKKASLETYAENGIGDCFQTTLTICLFLEKLKSLGYITGSFRIQQMEVEDPEHSGTHIWAEAENDELSVAMDVAGKYYGDITGHEKTLYVIARLILWG